MSTNDRAIEMFVGGLVLDPNTQAPVVILKDETGDINLPIWIGISEATSIASVIKQLQMARPLTHDLMYDLLGQLGAEIQRVMVTDLKDSTYYAELILSHGDKAIIIDCRPSDAIALALRAEAPIFVTNEVLQQARVATEGTGTSADSEGQESSENPGEGDEGAAEDSVEEESRRVAEQSDFTAIDKEKWNELLKDLDPEDFKHKM